MTKKPESLDCVAMKRRAQRALVKALAGKSPAEQVEMIHRLAARAPLWQELAKARTERPAQAVRTREKHRSAG